MSYEKCECGVVDEWDPRKWDEEAAKCHLWPHWPKRYGGCSPEKVPRIASTGAAPFEDCACGEDLALVNTWNAEASSGEFRLHWPKRLGGCDEGMPRKAYPCKAPAPATAPVLKKDADKPRMDLIPTRAITEIGKVFAFGAKKYSAHGWRQAAAEWCRYGAACLRHVFAWLGGEDNDPESGLSHLAHAGCCILIMLEYVLTKTGKDDRYKEAA